MALTTRKGFSNPSKTTRQQIPPFLDKLYHMVSDPTTETLIRWSESGDSFYVYDHERFAKEVLPHWFKHGKFGSFVRQLNNYGFHKVPHLQQGVLRSDGEAEISHFENPYFQRGQSDLLNLIQRKKQTTADVREDSPDAEQAAGASGAANGGGATADHAHSSHNHKGAVLDVNGILNGIHAIKRHQHAISSELKELHQSNQRLWQEAYAARERHKKHHDTITRILKFLAGVFGQTQGNAGPHNQEMSHDSGNDSLPSNAVVPRRQNRLMIENGAAMQRTAAEVLDQVHLNMDDMEPLDFEGGRANDGDRFATIETPGSPGSSSTKLESLPIPSPKTSSEHSSNPPPSSLQPVNSQTYFYPTSNNGPQQVPQGPSQSSPPDFLLPSGTNSSAVDPNAQSDQMVKNAITSLFNNPTQFHRVMNVLQTQIPFSIPPDGSAENASAARDIASPVNFRPPADGQLSPGATISLLSAMSNMGALPALPSGDDARSQGALAHSEHQLQKSYKDAAEVEADVNALQGHIDSLIESLGLDSDTSAALRGENTRTDEDIVASEASAPHTLPPQLVDINPDFDLEAFLSQDFDGSAGAVPPPNGLDAAAQRNGAEQLSAFLDEVSNEPDTEYVSHMGDNASLDRESVEALPSRKRKSDVAVAEDLELKKTRRKR